MDTNLKNISQFRILLETINRMPRITHGISFKKMCQVIKNSIIIHNNDSINWWIYNPDNLVIEMSGSFPTPDKLINQIKNSKNDIQFTQNDILILLNKDWKFYNDFKNLKDPKMFRIKKFNFENDLQILLNLWTFITDEEDLSNFKYDKNNEHQLLISLFKKQCKNSNGILLDVGDEWFLCLNDNYNQKTIIHELNHYFQKILFIDLIEQNEILNINECQFLGKSLNEIKYYLSKEEFIPHINDFCYDVKIVKDMYFKDMTNQQFLNQLLNELQYISKKKTKFSFYECNIFKQYMLMNKDKESLYSLIISKILKYHFDKVIQYLKEQFKN